MASWRRRPAELPADRALVVYRQTDRRWPALWMGAGDRLQASARWHHRGEGDEHLAQYLSLHPLGAWAELVRYQGIRDEAQLEEVRRRLWRLVVRPRGIADLATFEAIDACGLDPAGFVSDDYERAQALAEELRADAFTGLAAPSAALAGVVNLTLFGARFPYEDTGPPPPPLPDDVLAASVAADAARPEAALLGHVRHYGAPHAGYEAWRGGCQRR